MATAEEIKAQIDAAQLDLGAATEQVRRLSEENEHAIERQRLRRELDRIRAEIGSKKSHRPKLLTHSSSHPVPTVGSTRLE